MPAGGAEGGDGGQTEGSPREGEAAQATEGDVWMDGCMDRWKDF